jgi:hypothetical protein
MKTTDMLVAGAGDCRLVRVHSAGGRAPLPGAGFNSDKLMELTGTIKEFNSRIPTRDSDHGRGRQRSEGRGSSNGAARIH